MNPKSKPQKRNKKRKQLTQSKKPYLQVRISAFSQRSYSKTHAAAPNWRSRDPPKSSQIQTKAKQGEKPQKPMLPQQTPQRPPWQAGGDHHRGGFGPSRPRRRPHRRRPIGEGRAVGLEIDGGSKRRMTTSRDR